MTVVQDDMKMIEAFVLSVTNASSIKSSELIQTLWSDYGEIRRFFLDDGSSIVAKIVDTSSIQLHPKGWNTQESHLRKVKSYEVEEQWYSSWSVNCSKNTRVPSFLGVREVNGKRVFLLEDLDAAGFRLRKTELTDNEFRNCIEWLANFHGQFIGDSPKELWEQGTYWHLSTRKKEWEAMPNSMLKENAQLISDQLDSAVHQTIIHGDAKVANFCFSKNGEVSAVDFQYVGGGCGMKDLVYFMGSCLPSPACFEREEQILSYYFETLKKGVTEYKKNINFELLELEWRSLYSFAWADFTRFLTGWMPNHQKLNEYAFTQTQYTLTKLYKE